MSANSSRIGLKIFIALAVLAAVAVGAVFAFRPVAKVNVVKSGLQRKTVSGTVVVTAEKLSEIKSEAEGRLIESQLLAGKVVQAEETLAQIDASALDIEIKHIESELDSARQNIAVNVAVSELGWKSTEEDFKLNQRLHEQNSVSDVAFTKIERAYDGAKQARELTRLANAQQVEGLEHQLATLRLRRNQTTVKAPFIGVIARVMRAREKRDKALP